MNKDLIIDVTPSEIVFALLEDKRLIELTKESSSTSFSVGDIYLGRVKKIMSGLNACFVDIGYKKDAFLHYHDMGPQFNSLNKYIHNAISYNARPQPLSKFRLLPDINKNGKIADIVSVGQPVLVQIVKEPISTKGPRLSSEISIAGRNMILIPFSNKVSISQRIEDRDERNRLKNLIQSIKLNNYGVIIRTVAENKKVVQFDIELRELVKKWEDSFLQLRAIKPPRLMIRELNRTSTILRDFLNDSFNNIYINDKNILTEVKEYIRNIAPEKEKIVKHYNRTIPIFEHFDISKQIKSLFGKTVSFKSGAYLIIEQTEALFAIDVNSGNLATKGKDQESNALEINLAAAEEITRQFRLRDMGGIIIIDYIDIHKPEHKQMVYDKMRQLMANDKAKHLILPLTKFNLMQITRERVRPAMYMQTIEKCPTCNGTGEITSSLLFTDEIENKLRKVVAIVNKGRILIKTHPFIAAYLTKRFLSIRFRWIWRFNRKISIQPVSSYTFLEYHFFDDNYKEIAV